MAQIVMGKNGSARVTVGIQQESGIVSYIMIAADGLTHHTASRDKFLREFNRDLLVEEWTALCKFLKIALANSNNEDYAISTLMKGFQMKIADLKDKSVEELVSMHNELAAAQDKKPVTKFKSLEAGRIAVIKLSNAAQPKKKADKAATGGGAEGRPRSGVGTRAKELLLTGISNSEVLEKVKAEFPNNATTLSCIAYYRNALVKAGQIEGGRRKKEEADKPPKDAKPSKAPKGKGKSK